MCLNLKSYESQGLTNRNYSLHQMHKIRHKGGVSVRTPRNLGFAHEVQCVSVTHGTYNYRIQKVK